MRRSIRGIELRLNPSQFSLLFPLMVAGRTIICCRRGFEMDKSQFDVIVPEAGEGITEEGAEILALSTLHQPEDNFRSPFRLKDGDTCLDAVSADFRDVHGVADDRQGMKLSGSFGSQVVANLPDSFGQFIDEEGDFPVP